MAVDVTWISFYAPILAFLLVLFIVYAVLLKTEILGKSHWAIAIVSVIVATIFVSAVGLTNFVTDIVPWFGAFAVSVVLLLALVGFTGGNVDFLKTGIGVGAAVLLLIIAIASGYVLFSDKISPFLPGGTFYYPRFLGGIALLIIGGVVSWVLIKFK
jgi:membrane-associated HD superfamily phosphohydrolase